MRIKLATDTLTSSDLEKLTGWISTKPQLTKGEKVLEFEQKFANWMGVKEAIFVNSGSSANLLMLYGLMCRGDLEKGDKVVIPAICWATDIAPVVQLGFTPVIIDVNMRNIAVDPVQLEKVFEEHKPKALLLVSVLGMPPDMEEISYMCHKHNVILLEDNCESIGSRFDGHKLGTYGMASTISTYFGHHMSTIEGGLIFTNNSDLANVLRMIRAHGWDRDLPENIKSQLKGNHNISDFNARYTFYFPGFNFRPTEINAFLGLLQLEKLDDFIQKRKENFDFYQKCLSNVEWKPQIPIENFVSNLGYPIIHTKRNKIAAALDKIGVECRPFISGNIARQPAYSGMFNGLSLPNADLVHEYGMYLPNHYELSQSDIFEICSTINKITL